MFKKERFLDNVEARESLTVVVKIKDIGGFGKIVEGTADITKELRHFFTV